jgi:hypothetical protein
MHRILLYFLASCYLSRAEQQFHQEDRRWRHQQRVRLARLPRVDRATKRRSRESSQEGDSWSVRFRGQVGQELGEKLAFLEIHVRIYRFNVIFLMNFEASAAFSMDLTTRL